MKSAGGPNDINVSDDLFRCPSKSWQCDSESAWTKAANRNSAIIHFITYINASSSTVTRDWSYLIIRRTLFRVQGTFHL